MSVSRSFSERLPNPRLAMGAAKWAWTAADSGIAAASSNSALKLELERRSNSSSEGSLRCLDRDQDWLYWGPQPPIDDVELSHSLYLTPNWSRVAEIGQWRCLLVVVINPVLTTGA